MIEEIDGVVEVNSEAQVTEEEKNDVCSPVDSSPDILDENGFYIDECGAIEAVLIFCEEKEGTQIDLNRTVDVEIVHRCDDVRMMSRVDNAMVNLNSKYNFDIVDDVLSVHVDPSGSECTRNVDFGDCSVTSNEMLPMNESNDVFVETMCDSDGLIEVKKKEGVANVDLQAANLSSTAEKTILNLTCEFPRDPCSLIDVKAGSYEFLNSLIGINVCWLSNIDQWSCTSSETDILHFTNDVVIAKFEHKCKCSMISVDLMLNDVLNSFGDDYEILVSEGGTENMFDRVLNCYLGGPKINRAFFSEPNETVAIFFLEFDNMLDHIISECHSGNWWLIDLYLSFSKGILSEGEIVKLQLPAKVLDGLECLMDVVDENSSIDYFNEVVHHSDDYVLLDSINGVPVSSVECDIVDELNGTNLVNPVKIFYSANDCNFLIEVNADGDFEYFNLSLVIRNDIGVEFSFVANLMAAGDMVTSSSVVEVIEIKLSQNSKLSGVLIRIEINSKHLADLFGFLVYLVVLSATLTLRLVQTIDKESKVSFIEKETYLGSWFKAENEVIEIGIILLIVDISVIFKNVYGELLQLGDEFGGLGLWFWNLRPVKVAAMNYDFDLMFDMLLWYWDVIFYFSPKLENKVNIKGKGIIIKVLLHAWEITECILPAYLRAENSSGSNVSFNFVNEEKTATASIPMAIAITAKTRHRSCLIRRRTRRSILNFRCCSASSSSSMPLEVEDPISHVTPSPPLPQDCLSYSRAFWVSKSVVAWNVEAENGSCFLYASGTADLFVADNVIQGYDVKIELRGRDGGLPQYVIEKFPHIRDYNAFTLPPNLDVQSLLKCQLAVALSSGNGSCTSATSLQLPGVLDELFSYNGPLGAIFLDDGVSLNLWAPTAQSVHALIYKDLSSGDPPEIIQLKELSGVWSAKGPKDWEGCYYVYEVCVYHSSTLQIEKCMVNDPYARGLSGDGRRTLLVNLNSSSLKPEGWDNLADEKPGLLSFADISIYELHIRDFSANDYTVHPDLRGGYLAFTQNSAGVLHLKRLSSAGITHVHLLPTFQFAGVDDEKQKWKHVDCRLLESFPPDSDQQQAYITAIQDDDGYNWGYNPVLWGVPKGSYASDPNGSCRNLEFRKMVQALNQIGLRVVLDVVYNHVHGSGPFDENSILDKIVPGYYLRRNIDGFIEQSTCTNNTASEHFMVERLILDDLLCWAIHYKVDGFRFDLMGHLMKQTMVKAKAMLQGLSKQLDGVDGSSIYLYGEGWDFGEVAKNGRGVNASQLNLPGTGIGSFNDRIRDASLGGSPFGHPLQQGFVTGLVLEPNGHDHGTKGAAEHMHAVSKDHIQVGMAANLRDFVLTNFLGQEVKGSEVLTHDRVPVAYALGPTETINYVSAHDNETLFDIVSLKTPVDIPLEDRCRMNHLATSIVALSQGIPFFHAGDELLRSKSLDRDSYNSGDWFNRLDFSYNSNNWGVGLPPRGKNEHNWPLIKSRLAVPDYKPQKCHIVAAVENFLSLIQIRYSSPLFRLRTANEIQARVKFHNTGPSSIPGVIVMSITDGYEGIPGLTEIDHCYSSIVVIMNARPTDVTFNSPVLRARTLELHPVQMVSTDDIVKKSTYDASLGCFQVPARTTSVFVEPRGA
ncbi:OLC1v1026154C1 [Oldenlandia corymbosa var. corymbosa]|uniref:OLC1v1026154C1 n=1 Tax=Oldenlandia corymbosa var. corymbosa TaxID=529605 RepID=A0AAV1C978_OLDCO|nr:OLC1v1026154C1 [Oldenlandia corymbosa var. corymbosa]